MMTVIYTPSNKPVKPVKPRRYEVQWLVFRRWEHWSWHRFEWAARVEKFVCGPYDMRIVDHGKLGYTEGNNETTEV